MINTSRGGLVVEADLRDALLSGHLAGAGLDVLNQRASRAGLTRFSDSPMSS